MVGNSISGVPGSHAGHAKVSVDCKGFFKQAEILI